MARRPGDSCEQPDRQGAASELDADELLRALIRHEAEFVVVGGFAVVAHSYTRATNDIDVVPHPTAENRRKLFTALATLEARPLEEGDLRPEEMPLEWNEAALSYGGNWALSDLMRTH